MRAGLFMTETGQVWKLGLVGEMSSIFTALAAWRHDAEASTIFLSAAMQRLIEMFRTIIKDDEERRIVTLADGVDDTAEFACTLASLRFWVIASKEVLAGIDGLIERVPWATTSIPVKRERAEELRVQLQQTLAEAISILTPDEKFFGSELFSMANEALDEHRRGDSEPLLSLQ